MNTTQLELIHIKHQVEGKFVPQRAVDGYVDASAMCKAVNKNFENYRKLAATGEFLQELGLATSLAPERLVQTFHDGFLTEVWVHPEVAINLAQWCSPKFAVAVAMWVRDWMAGKTKVAAGLPYHIERYMANRSEIPATHFSMLNELTFGLIAPLESEGYTLPESLVPDISEGRIFCQWLRDAKEIDTDTLPKYQHKYKDGRVVWAKLYPNELLADFRKHFNEEWLPNRSIKYFEKKDPNALPFLTKMLSSPKSVPKRISEAPAYGN
jgi:hypothetical protein